MHRGTTDETTASYYDASASTLSREGTAMISLWKYFSPLAAATPLAVANAQQAGSTPEIPPLPSTATAVSGDRLGTEQGPILQGHVREAQPESSPGPLLIPAPPQPSRQPRTDAAEPPATYGSNEVGEEQTPGRQNADTPPARENNRSRQITPPTGPRDAEVDPRDDEVRGTAQDQERAAGYRAAVPAIPTPATPTLDGSAPTAPAPTTSRVRHPDAEYQIEEGIRQATQDLAIDDETRSRYRLYEGEWWFQARSGGWKYFREGAWHDFDPRSYVRPEVALSGVQPGGSGSKPHITLRPNAAPGAGTGFEFSRYGDRYGYGPMASPFGPDGDQARRDLRRFDDDDDAGRRRRQVPPADGRFSENGWAEGYPPGGPYPGAEDPPPEERNRRRPLRTFLGRVLGRR